MNKVQKVAAFTAVALLPYTASAITFTGTTLGAWVNPISNFYTITNNDAGGLASFNFGQDAGINFSNLFTFDGAGSDLGDLPWTTASEAQFRIADFSYRNGSTSGSTTAVNLSVTLNLTDPLVATQSFVFPFAINLTTNTTGNPVLDGDIVTINNPSTVFTFNHDSTAYTLGLVGFSTDGGQTLNNQFNSPEGSAALAGVYARITTNLDDPNNPNDPTTVPEPATIGLTALGLAILGIRRRRIAV